MLKIQYVTTHTHKTISASFLTQLSYTSLQQLNTLTICIQIIAYASQTNVKINVINNHSIFISTSLFIMIHLTVKTRVMLEKEACDGLVTPSSVEHVSDSWQALQMVLFLQRLPIYNPSRNLMNKSKSWNCSK